MLLAAARTDHAMIAGIVRYPVLQHYRIEPDMNPLRPLFAITLIVSSAGSLPGSERHADASIVVVANQVDVDAGHLANTKWRITSRCSMRATRR
jgi:hypothetical protein